MEWDDWPEYTCPHCGKTEHGNLNAHLFWCDALRKKEGKNPSLKELEIETG